MRHPVVCFCGLSVDCYAGLFVEARRRLIAARLEKSGGTAAGSLPGASHPCFELDMSDVFEALGVRRDCCRTRLATGEVMAHYY